MQIFRHADSRGLTESLTENQFGDDFFVFYNMMIINVLCLLL